MNNLKKASSTISSDSNTVTSSTNREGNSKSVRMTVYALTPSQATRDFYAAKGASSDSDLELHLKNIAASPPQNINYLGL